MISVPGFLLRRLYVKKSLRNESGGFAFELKNGLGSGYAYKLQPLTVDGVEMSTEDSHFIVDERKTAFSDVSRENTFTLAMNKSITITVDNVALEPGTRKIGMGFDVPGLGTLRFDFTDLVTGK